MPPAWSIIHSIRYSLPDVVLYVVEPELGHDNGVGDGELAAVTTVLAVVVASRACVGTLAGISATYLAPHTFWFSSGTPTTPFM